MAEDDGFDGGAFTVEGDKDDLIGETQRAVGKGGHLLQTSNSFTSEGSHKNESSPLHKAKQLLHSSSGKEISQSRGLKIIIVSAVLFAIIITIALILSIVFGEPQVGGNAGVAADVPLCSDMGRDILRDGGNAVDAMVTTMLCVGVVDAQSSGLGGGGFMLIHDHKSHVSSVIDFREMAPAMASPGMYPGKGQSLMGGLAVGVPGELKGMQTAHNKHGKLSWQNVVQPAANLARNGFKVTPSMAKVFTEGKVKESEFTGMLGEIYLDENRDFVKQGTLISRPQLANTLDIIAEHGADAFYDGQLSQSIIDAVSNATPPGIMTREDLKNYDVVIREAVKTTYNGHTILSTPAPASGSVLLFIMNVLEGFKLTKADKNSVQAFHRIVETLKFAFEKQQQLGDPDKDSTGQVKNTTEMLASKAEAKKIRSLISNVTMDETGQFNKLDKGTSHISIIDAQELMVSVTTTVNMWFGSRVMTSTGILLNDQMADFFIPTPGSSQPSNQLNAIGPGKRPLSNMAPTMLLNEDRPCALRMVVGAANGSRIISGVVETLLNVVSFGETNLTKAILEPRIHYDAISRDTEYEPGFKDSIVKGLTDLGHTMVATVEGINIVQAVSKVNNTLQAVSDPRKWGRAATLE
ncbi:gamma-glutamyltranspeptidase 1-like [Mizuhopecten yessoensis]|uniref:Gamma-glutamyltranspeptidase 1 n=1 Tax=Mizuhopecten yessoensis TaxID=6573 RepID=A0A210Q1U8_MIZYE|nr:gamma-glutamyltranspeptidase 1-like [Mizuhopecten yessoensis]OWF42718.1 Gamma-glutamyltranspeptidase 1 [Mizuhopecten yessoensis]